MFTRCRNTLSGHEASIPTALLPSLPDWTPVDGAQETDVAQGPTFATDDTTTPVPQVQALPTPEPGQVAGAGDSL